MLSRTDFFNSQLLEMEIKCVLKYSEDSFILFLNSMLYIYWWLATAKSWPGIVSITLESITE